MVFNDRVANLTYQDIKKSVVDQINNSNILTARLFASPKEWKGVYSVQPVQTSNSDTGGFFDGMDEFSTAATNTTQVMTWYIKAFEQSIVVPGLEKLVNGNREKQAVSLVAQKMDEGKNSAANTIGTAFYSVGAGKAFEGVGLIVDAGTNSASYAGLTRSSNTWINADVTASGGTISLDLLSQEFDNVSAAGSDQESPNLGLTTKAVWSFVEGLLQPSVNATYQVLDAPAQYVTGRTPSGATFKKGAPELKAAAGFRALTYRASPLVADDKCTSQTFFWLNENYLEYQRMLDPDLETIGSTNQVTEGSYEDAPMPKLFQMREFMNPINQYGEMAALITIGNLVCKAPRRQGKLTGITGN